jgi:hypothetical protein
MKWHPTESTRPHTLTARECTGRVGFEGSSTLETVPTCGLQQLLGDLGCGNALALAEGAQLADILQPFA